MRTLRPGLSGAFAAILLHFVAGRLGAQPAQLLRDIFPDDTPYASIEGSFPRDFVLAGGSLFFTAGSDSGDHRLLWKTDGTPEGTVPVRDPTPGTPIGSLGSDVILAGEDGLWRSDGTPAGTVRIKKIHAIRSDHGGTSRPAAASGALYFVADDGIHGQELWRTDGTEDGTFMVKDVAMGSDDSLPISLTAVGNTLFFFLDASLARGDLWKTDGTETGTVLVKSLPMEPGAPVVVGETLIFRECSAVCALWRSDGTELGTDKLWDAPPGDKSLGSLVSYAGSAYFDGDAAQLWRTDGTTPGTALVKDFRSGFFANGPRTFAIAGGLLYFAGNDDYTNDTPGDQLWVTDGTASGTRRLADLGSALPLEYVEDPVAIGSTLFFHATSLLDDSLWKSDGTVSGTVRVKLLWNSAPNYSVSPAGELNDVGGVLVMAADDSRHGRELWKSDGTEAGTGMLRDIRRGPNSSYPAGFFSLGPRVLFEANDWVHGPEPWVSDGTEAGTRLLKDIQPGPDSLGLSGSFVQLNDFVLFSSLQELWKTDGTPAGTSIVKAVPFAEPKIHFGDFVFFLGGDWSGNAIWKTDGTEAGTVVVLDPSPSPIAPFVELGGAFYFLAISVDRQDYGLWKSDGTAAGTVLVKTLNPVGGNTYYQPGNLMRSGSALYFRAWDSMHGFELWKSNGTADGTELLKDINPGPPESWPWQLTDANGTLYFSAFAGGGFELWKSDGTADGTTLVRRIGDASLVWGSQPYGMTVAGGVLFFGAEDSAHGVELWRSDGTEAGTTLVRDILPGPIGSFPQHLTDVDGTLLFAAQDEAHGLELWRSDGTEEGTTLFQDVNPGPALSLAPDYVGWSRAGSRLYFSADSGELGYELWSLPTAMVTGTAILPSSGPAGGGTQVTVSGWGLQEGATLTIGGLAAADLAVGSPAYVTATSPAFAPGTLHDVVLEKPGSSPVTIPQGWFADFSDVPAEYLFHGAIERIFRAGLTNGCGSGAFCPEVPVTRATMAIFLLRGKHGAAYHPPKASGTVFDDVPADAFGADWIEEAAAEGVTKGCAARAFCPSALVTRDQMAVLVVRARHAPGYLPPAAVGLFSDVPASSPYARWIEELAREGIGKGCGNGQYCPSGESTRGQTAALLQRAFLSSP